MLIRSTRAAVLLLLSSAIVACDSGSDYSTTFDPDGTTDNLTLATVGFGSVETTSFVGMSTLIGNALLAPPALMAAPGFASAIDPNAFGKLFAYNEANERYEVVLGDDLPPNVVRFLLYVPIAGQETPIVPLQISGVVEITRTIAGADTSARVVVRDNDNVPSMDYTIRRATGVPNPAIAVEGWAGTGEERTEFEGVIPPHVQAGFSAPFSYDFTSYVPALGLRQRIALTILEESQAVAFEQRRGGNNVKLLGSYLTGDPTFVMTATAGGRVFARVISDLEGGISYEDSQGFPLVGPTFLAVQTMFFASQQQTNLMVPFVFGVRSVLGDWIDP